jgi:hypothetical protein
MAHRRRTYAAEVPHPTRSLLAAALGCLLVLAVPGSVGAAGGRAEAQPNGFSRAAAQDVLHHARSLMRTGRSSTASRPASSDLTMALRDLHLARPALTGADRRAADRLLSRATPAGNARASAALPPRCSTHFCVHYGPGTTLSWANTTLATMEHVWSVEVPMMGHAPLSDGGSAAPDENNPDNRVDVFLEDLGNDGYYGYCTTDDITGHSQVSAYCALDNDFARSQYGAAPINSLRVTAAHEFFHAIQFGLDVTEATWFMEGSATWMEDVVYDSIDDNYQYLQHSPIRFPRISLDYGGGAFPYGSFVFFSFAAQRRGNVVVRHFWEGAVGAPRSLQAVRTVVGPTWPAFFTTFASWNTLPNHSYLERAGYPAPAWWQRKTLTAGATTTGLHAVRVPHLGSAAVLLTPGPHLAVRKRLVVTIDGPPKATGTAALLQRRFRDGRVTHTMITLGANGNRQLVVPFNHKILRSIGVVVANTSTSGVARLFKVRAGLR